MKKQYNKEYRSLHTHKKRSLNVLNDFNSVGASLQMQQVTELVSIFACFNFGRNIITETKYVTKKLLMSQNRRFFSISWSIADFIRISTNWVNTTFPKSSLTFTLASVPFSLALTNLWFYLAVIMLQSNMHIRILCARIIVYCFWTEKERKFAAVNYGLKKWGAIVPRWLACSIFENSLKWKH